MGETDLFASLERLLSGDKGQTSYADIATYFRTAEQFY
jgi:hypothetical protein